MASIAIKSKFTLAEEITGLTIEPNTPDFLSFSFLFDFPEGMETVRVVCHGLPYTEHPEEGEEHYQTEDSLGLIIAYRPQKVRFYANTPLLSNLVPGGYVLTSTSCQCLDYPDDEDEIILEGLKESYSEWRHHLESLYSQQGNYRYIPLTKQEEPWRGSFLLKNAPDKNTFPPKQQDHLANR